MGVGQSRKQLGTGVARGGCLGPYGVWALGPQGPGIESRLRGLLPG